MDAAATVNDPTGSTARGRCTTGANLHGRGRLGSERVAPLRGQHNDAVVIVHAHDRDSLQLLEGWRRERELSHFGKNLAVMVRAVLIGRRPVGRGMVRTRAIGVDPWAHVFDVHPLAVLRAEHVAFEHQVGKARGLRQ
jgi:hypothetical protein